MPKVLVVGRLAEAYIAYVSLASDMTMAGVLLGELVARPPVEGESDPVAGALWSAAVVGYARCFRTGRRKAYADKVPVPDEMRERHRWLLDHRNEHIAHLSRENEAEQAKVLLFLQPVGEPRAVAGAGWFGIRMVMPAADGLEGMRQLAAHFEEAFTALADAANKRIVEQGQAVPVDQVYEASERGRAMRIDEEFPP